jgi:NAD(P)-dependent dehydrogenase (short-subunit alcohol dehydrogenase family)
VADINGPNAEKVAQEVKQQGGLAEGLTVDVSREEQAERMVARAVELWQRVDILVNNAVSFVRKEVQDATQADWHAVLGVNVLGISFCSKYAVRVMQQQNKGAIVNIGSINAIVALPGATTYNTTKGAIVNMSKSMAMGLAPYNIRVNCVCPGITRTPALDEIIGKLGWTYEQAEKIHEHHLLIKRFARADEIAPAILFAASDEASYVTGATIMADGGYTAC